MLKFWCNKYGNMLEARALVSSVTCDKCGNTMQVPNDSISLDHSRGRIKRTSEAFRDPHSKSYVTRYRRGDALFAFFCAIIIDAILRKLYGKRWYLIIAAYVVGFLLSILVMLIKEKIGEWRANRRKDKAPSWQPPENAKIDDKE